MTSSERTKITKGSVTADATFVAPAWSGTNPFFLMVVPEPIVVILDDGSYGGERQPGPTRIDLDERGWMETLKEVLAEPGEWHLCRKTDELVVLSLRVYENDQPYYVGRHIATTASPKEVIAYGIGKKAKRLRKGSWHDNEDNLWVLPWGQICGGTDVEYFALKGLRAGLA